MPTAAPIQQRRARTSQQEQILVSCVPPFGTRETEKTAEVAEYQTFNFDEQSLKLPLAAPALRPSQLRSSHNDVTRLDPKECNRIDDGGVATATIGNELFRTTFDEAEPLPAVHNGACRG
jgi:hypothetical protein